LPFAKILLQSFFGHFGHLHQLQSSAAKITAAMSTEAAAVETPAAWLMLLLLASPIRTMFENIFPHVRNRHKTLLYKQPITWDERFRDW
jgi:hypothetical protein